MTFIDAYQAGSGSVERWTPDYRLCETPTGYALQRKKEIVHYDHTPGSPTLSSIEFRWEVVPTIPLTDGVTG